MSRKRYPPYHLTDAHQAALILGGMPALIVAQAHVLETHMTTRESRLSDARLARIREAVHPGVREVEMSADEVTSMLNEIEQARIPVLDIDPEARTRTLPREDEAIARYNTLLRDHASDMPGAAEDWIFALGFFLGLGLPLETARHLSLRV